MAERVKVELGFNRIARLNGLDDLARILFPGNRNHQRTFLAVFLELKYAEGGLLASLNFIPKKYKVSRRTLQRVRAKARKLGLIDHISRNSAPASHSATALSPLIRSSPTRSRKFSVLSSPYVLSNSRSTNGSSSCSTSTSAS